jgi:hypothetical protein
VKLEHLRTKAHKLTSTIHGPLDVLGSIQDEELVHEDLLPDTDQMAIGDSEIRVLRLGKIIELKRRLGRPKDLLALLILEATQSERGNL